MLVKRCGFVVVTAGVLALSCGGKSTVAERAGAGGESASGGAGGGPASGGTGGRSASGGKGGGTESGGTAGDSASGGTSGDAGTGGVTGGSSGRGGTGGSGGTPDPGQATQLDLLLMIDNSNTMASKQALLAGSLPYLFEGLANELGVTDVHVGVITSSLGDHGSADVCSVASASPDNTYNDLAQLLPSVRTGLSLPAEPGFLSWGPSEQGEIDVTAVSEGVADLVLAAGERGCGYEASLEAWYRFLVDPEPIAQMGNDGDPQNGRPPALGVRGPVNQLVLAQRAAFLRPDSAVVVLMLSDENDCSIIDENGTQGWLVPFKGGVSVNNWRMPRAHAICATRPDDPGCLPCSSGDPDPACSMGQSLTVVEDAPNLRCLRQKQRFGIDLLYPVERYVDALTEPAIDPRYSGVTVPNPLFAGGRSPGNVFLMGIVGVPWQDLSTEESWDGPGLEYLTAAELESEGRWPMIVGDLEAGVEPTDPLMLEAVDPRPTGAAHPLLGAAAAVAPPDSTDSDANPINGHELQVITTERANLQFACIFPLPEPVPCTMANEHVCDCNADEFVMNSPACRYETPNTDGTQLYGKAYPSLRTLSVLQRIGSQAVPASLCAKKVVADGSPEEDPEYAYNPSMRALIERLRPIFTP